MKGGSVCLEDELYATAFAFLCRENNVVCYAIEDVLMRLFARRGEQLIRQVLAISRNVFFEVDEAACAGSMRC
jgi:hypothetical protein